MPVIKLTQQLIANELVCPEGKSRVELCDAEVRGLYVEVRASSPGQGTFYLRYKDPSDKTCHQKIGRTTDVDLAEARRRARRLRAEIALGADPRGEARAQREVLTFDVFFREHYMPYVSPRKRSWRSDELLYAKRIKDEFGGRRLNQITRQQIQDFHTSLRSTGLAPATCDHHVKLIKHALNLAIDWGMLGEKNPAARVPLFNPDNKVEHRLDDEQLARLVTVLRTDRNRTACRIALLLLSTGARLSEALNATWENIDVERRLWIVPATTSKSKRARSIPLNDSALEVLEQVGSGGGYVFANKKTGKPYTTIANPWERMREKAGLPHLRLHDLRHAYASMLVNDGRTLYEVQRILGHSTPKVTERYAHLSQGTLQDAAASASEKIRGAAGGPG